MIIILILINILCYWIYYTVRSNSYVNKYNCSTGCYSKKCPLPLYEVVLVGFLIIVPGGFIAILFWLAMSWDIYDIVEVRISDKHILKRIYRFITKDLAK